MLASATIDVLLDGPWWGHSLAAAAVLVIGIAKSGFGGGVGILAVPMFVLAMGPKRGLGAMLPLMLVADAFSVYHHWGSWDRRNLVVLMPGTITGMGVGIALLAWLLAEHGTGQPPLASAEHSMRVAIGMICVLYVVGNVVRNRYAPHWRWNANWGTGTTAGTSAGIVSTLAHAGGPVTAIFLLGQHLPKRQFIGTTVVYFFIVNALKLIPYGYLGMIDTSTLTYGLWLLPLVPLGTLAGAHLNRVMGEALFRNSIMILVLLTGLKMVLS
jgi:uncharacterized membrane protein YfcA